MALSDRALCSLADLKTELSISDSSEDTRLERLIESATRAIERYCDRPEGFQRELARVDDVKGHGTPALYLPKTPVISIGSVVWDPNDANETVTATEYAIDRGENGRVYREQGWQWTAALNEFMLTTPLPGTEQRLYRFTYECGYILPGQVATTGIFPPATVTIARSSTTATVSHTAHGLESGDMITISGADQSEYNVTKATITKIDADSYSFYVTGSPVTPATGTITATVVQTLPFDLEDACLQLTSMRYQWSARDPSIASESLLSWSASYSAESASGLMPEAIASVLSAYQRIVTA